MISLQKYSAALIVASKPKAVDLELTLNLHAKYATQLNKFLNTNFAILDFNCSDNEIVKTINLITTIGNVKFIIELDAFETNSITLQISDQAILTASYDTYDEFVNQLKLLTATITNNATKTNL